MTLTIVSIEFYANNNALVGCIEAVENNRPRYYRCEILRITHRNDYIYSFLGVAYPIIDKIQHEREFLLSKAEVADLQIALNNYPKWKKEVDIYSLINGCLEKLTRCQRALRNVRRNYSGEIVSLVISDEKRADFSDVLKTLNSTYVGPSDQGHLYFMPKGSASVLFGCYEQEDATLLIKNLRTRLTNIRPQAKI